MPRGWVTDTDAVSPLVAALDGVVTRMRVKSTAEADPVSQDIFISITAELEKHH